MMIKIWKNFITIINTTPFIAFLSSFLTFIATYNIQKHLQNTEKLEHRFKEFYHPYILKIRDSSYNYTIDAIHDLALMLAEINEIRFLENNLHILSKENQIAVVEFINVSFFVRVLHDETISDQTLYYETISDQDMNSLIEAFNNMNSSIIIEYNKICKKLGYQGINL